MRRRLGTLGDRLAGKVVGSLRVVTIVAVGVVGLGLATPAPASAHDELVGTDPADGAMLDELPTELVLDYNGSIHKTFGEVTVTGPDGVDYADGRFEVSGRTLTQPLHPLGPAGEYVIGWRVVSSDGHPINGDLAFELTITGPGIQTADADQDDADGDPGGLQLALIAGGAVIVAAGGATAAVLRARRRERNEQLEQKEQSTT